MGTHHVTVLYVVDKSHTPKTQPNKTGFDWRGRSQAN